MKKFLFSVLAVAAVAVAVVALLHKPASAPENVGGNYESGVLSPQNPVYLKNGLTTNKFGTLTVATSSTSPAALGAAASGIVAVPTGTATLYASTTAISANSLVFFTQLATTTSQLLATGGAFVGNSGICSTTQSTTTPMYNPVISATSSLNGFKMTLANAPQTNSQCWEYVIVSNQ